MRKLFLMLMVFVAYGQCFAQADVQSTIAKVELKEDEKTLESQWHGKRVAFLGDSMTDKKRAQKSCLYWGYLTELLGIEPTVYGISGNQWDGVYKQALKLKLEKDTAIDAIFIFAGTNDYNHGIPLGEFFSESMREVNHNGKLQMRKYRTAQINDSTYCGRINKVMAYLKANFPQQQIIIMTPIHRGYAKFNDKNVQPDENYANGQGLYIDAYVDVLKKAAAIWSVPCIDLFSKSGLYPLEANHSQYFMNKDMDMLHLNAKGDYRLAKTIQYHLLTLPATFVME